MGSLSFHMENPPWRKSLGRVWKVKCPEVWGFLEWRCRALKIRVRTWMDEPKGKEEERKEEPLVWN